MHRRTGVVAWVIYAQAEPFAGVSGDEVIAMIKANPDARHGIPDWTDPVAAGVIERCWAGSGGARPAFEEVRDTLSRHYCGGEVQGDASDVYGGTV